MKFNVGGRASETGPAVFAISRVVFSHKHCFTKEEDSFQRHERRVLTILRLYEKNKAAKYNLGMAIKYA